MLANTSLWPVKLQYLFFSAGALPLFADLPVYGKRLGFTSYTMGLMLTVAPFVSMLVIPVLGKLADCYKCRKAALVSLQLLVAVGFVGLIFVPEVPRRLQAVVTSDALKICNRNVAKHYCKLSDLLDETVTCQFWCRPLKRTIALQPDHLHDDSSCIVIPVRGQDGLSQCQVTCDSDLLVAMLQESSMDDDFFYRYGEFWTFFGLFVTVWIAITAASSLAEVICLDVLGEENRHRYGHQLVFSSVGMGLSSPGFGYLQDTLSADDCEQDFACILIVASGLVVLSAVAAATIQYSQPDESKTSTSFGKIVGHVAADRRHLVFLAWTTAMGCLLSSVFNYFYWTVEELAEQSHSGNVKTIEGVSNAVESVGLAVFFFATPSIVDKFGYALGMSAALLAGAVRFAIYYAVKDPWWLLTGSILHGPMLGIFYPIAMAYSFEMAPSGCESTTQMIVIAAYDGIGEGLGGAVTAGLFQAWGGPRMYGVLAVACLCLFVVHAAVQGALRRSN